MFYRKYRPQKFSEVAQPNEIADSLAMQVKNGKIGHAYLFVGPRGTGKTTLARILAKAINCEKIDANGNPCCKCASCKSIIDGSFLDLIEIDAASNRGIDDIRDLKDKIRLAPSLGKKKVYIIDEVHMLTMEAFNALLKTLEEPPMHAIMILCTTEVNKVPDTIKSRCQVFKFKRASLPQLTEKLSDIATKEKHKISKNELEKIARASLGGFRDAETMLQQVIEGGLDVTSLSGRENHEDLVNFVGFLIEKDSKSALKKVNTIFEDGADLYTWTVSLIYYLRDLLFISAQASEGLVDVTEEVFSFMDEQANKMTTSEVVGMIEAFTKASYEIKSSVLPQLPIEIAIIKLCGLEDSEGDYGANLNKPSKNAVVSSGNLAVSKKGTDFGVKETGAALKTTFDTVSAGWGAVVPAAKTHNHGVQALLKACKPILLEGDKLTIEVFYKFHKERLETPSNRKVVEDILKGQFSEPIRFSCVLSAEQPKPSRKYESGELTDHNLTGPLSLPMGDSLVNVFDGVLPL